MRTPQFSLHSLLGCLAAQGTRYGGRIVVDHADVGAFVSSGFAHRIGE